MDSKKNRQHRCIICSELYMCQRNINKECGICNRKANPREYFCSYSCFSVFDMMGKDPVHRDKKRKLA